MTAAEQLMERGRVMERRENLLDLLRARFGSLAPAADARVLTADPEQLRQWLLRFATAATLAEVFEHEDHEPDGLVPESEERAAGAAAKRRIQALALLLWALLVASSFPWPGTGHARPLLRVPEVTGLAGGPPPRG